MSFQKCPICNGTGQEFGLGGSYDCSVCKGAKIIDQVTGMPPKKENQNNYNHQSDSYEEGRFLTKDSVVYYTRIGNIVNYKIGTGKFTDTVSDFNMKFHGYMELK